jgi:DNA polymerase-3 subunit chi
VPPASAFGSSISSSKTRSKPDPPPVQVDFYQLGSAPPEAVIASIAEKLLAQEARLLIVAEDEGLLTRLDRMLWDQQPTSFLSHALAGGADDARQPILLSTSPDAPNLARNLLIADGQWRDSALTYDRAFYLFDAATLEGARLAWKLLAGRDGVERRYWAQDGGRWKQKS